MIRTSLTGSFPPLYDPIKPIRYLPEDQQDFLVRRSIDRAVRDQIDLGIDILVEGQVRDDIVSLFCTRFPGFKGNALPYRVDAQVRPADGPITVEDYQYARALAGGHELKAHLTGPMTIVRDLIVEPDAPYAGKHDLRLVEDITAALCQEARLLVEAGARVVQIDESVLTDGVDLELACRMIRRIVDEGRIPFSALHVCGNVRSILEDLLRLSPVQMLSIDGSCLEDEQLLHIDRDYLRGSDVQFGLGCIDVADYAVERVKNVQDFVDMMVTRLGEEHVWGVMPNCSLRNMPYDIAIEKLKVMVAAVRTLEL